MVTAEMKETSNRPYPPPSNVVSVLQRLRSRNLPEKISNEFLRDCSIPEGTIARTLFAMRFLGLITDAGEPTQALRSMHTSTDEEYKGILSGLIRESYREVFNVIDPAQDSQDKILNVFRRYTPASQRERMVIFFLGMCREAGISTLDVPKARSMGTVRKQEQTRMGKEATTIGLKRRQETGKTGALIIDPALDGLIRTLPEPGAALSPERRKQWLQMAEATLKFLYPERAEEVDNDLHKKEETE